MGLGFVVPFVTHSVRIKSPLYLLLSYFSKHRNVITHHFKIKPQIRIFVFHVLSEVFLLFLFFIFQKRFLIRNHLANLNNCRYRSHRNSSQSLMTSTISSPYLFSGEQVHRIHKTFWRKYLTPTR